MKKFVPIMACAIPLMLLAGCGQKNVFVASTTPKNVQWASLSTSEQKAITEVSQHFGDANPKVVKITQDVTEANYKPMYFVWLTGNFHAGNVQTHDLSFSILGDGTKAWAITDKSGSLNGTMELKLN